MPSPSACDQTEEPPDRHVFCHHYDTCLNVALRSHWKGFACSGCRDYAPIIRDPAEWQAEEAHCTALLLAVFHPELTAKTRGKAARSLIEDRKGDQFEVIE